MTAHRKPSLIPALLLLAAAGTVWALPPADADYERGREALDRQDYRTAERAFLESIDSGGDQADAATYWLAYTLSRTGRTDEALERLADFQRDRPASRWSDDARKLHAELSENVNPEVVEEEEIRLIALHALAMADPPRAVGLLQKFIGETASPSLKEEALFVLMQSGSPEAKRVALDLARSSEDPALQTAAIRSLAMFGHTSAAELQGLYKSSANAEVKQAVLESYMIRGDKQSLVEVARSERDERLQSEAIEYLAAMGAIEEIEGVLGGSSSPLARKALLEAYMISGRVEPIREIAMGDGPMEQRRQAVEMLGAMGEIDAVRQAYKSSSDLEMRRAAIEAMGISGKGASMLRDIVRSESNPELRAAALLSLSYTGQASADEMVSIYRETEDPDVREAALEALMIQGGVDQLIDLARAEKDPAVKKRIIEILVVSGSEKAVDYLMELIDG